MENEDINGVLEERMKKEEIRKIRGIGWVEQKKNKMIKKNKNIRESW